MLKILYAGEDEELDINAEGDLVISAGGKQMVHKVQKGESKEDADMN